MFKKIDTSIIVLMTIICFSLIIFINTSSTMKYYVTPIELVSDSTLKNVGVRLSGQVVKNSYTKNEFVHEFKIKDIINDTILINVKFEGTLPATFTDESEVVLEGRMVNDIFITNIVLTKCGSRYEISKEDLEINIE